MVDHPRASETRPQEAFGDKLCGQPRPRTLVNLVLTRYFHFLSSPVVAQTQTVTPIRQGTGPDIVSAVEFGGVIYINGIII